MTSQITRNNSPSIEDLRPHHCLERVDIVPDDAATTAFKQTARLHQARWRERHGLEEGTQPMRPKAGQQPRPLGSRIELLSARRTGANFLNDKVRQVVEWRIAHPEAHEMINVDRLFCDLLSSMPMCFNLFGELHGKPEEATHAIRTLFPDTPGRVSEVRFEWSPGRRDPEYLGNRSAFDVAFELTLPSGQLGILGVETKYHEHCKTETKPTKEALKHYESVSMKSGVFKSMALREIVGTDLQQIWLDHLLALSMLQHPSGKWGWAKFVIVRPAQNPSYALASSRYGGLLTDQGTFSVRTLESILDANVLSKELSASFRDRYLW